jgi:penicillin-binding protein 2
MLQLSLKQETPVEFRRRVGVVATLASIAFLLVTARLLFLQVVHGERLSYLAENNRVRLKKVPGTRGMVFDRKGDLLVDSRPSFDILFVPEDAPEPETILKNLARHLGRDEHELLSLLEEKKGRPAFEEIVVGRDVDWPAVVAVETHQIDLPGVTLRIRPRRSYLDNRAAAHLLGYIGEVGPRQLKTHKDKGYTMGDEIGQFGLEKEFESFLRGRSGGQQVEVDALGRRVRVLKEVRDAPGHNVILTLESDLQEAAYEALAGKEGAVVVLDARDGAVLAMASAPAFDPNAFARGISQEEWRQLTRDRSYPLNNRAIQGQYPPGSTFKIVLAVAALEEGAIGVENQLVCNGGMAFGNRVFRDWKPEGHGAVDFRKGIAQSCDVYFYQLGQRLGIDRIARYARAFGLGQKSGIALADEKPGLIPDTEWKQRRFGQPWFPGETPSAAIGQGYITVTPLQMANLVAAVANGGTLYRPWFVRKVESLSGTIVREYGPEKIRSIPLKETTLAHLRQALREVVTSGTGGRARSDLTEIAGKTGTAQVVEMRGAYVKSEQLSYFARDHAWFVAYAPAENPEIAVAVLIEHGGHGGTTAAPAAKKVIEKYISLKKNEELT